MTVGSLFAGIGGFDLGFERAGFKTVWQVEIDEYCRKVLARHFPDAERFGDIRECGKHNLRAVDVICGGFPCQDISRKQTPENQGLDGERSGLWREMHRIVCELRPRFLVVENVPALLYRGIGRVLGDLATVGYDAEWECIPAASVGAPHLRDRVWILAYPAGQRRVIPSNARDEFDGSMEQRNDGMPAERSQNWKLVAMVPGVRNGTSANWWRAQSRVARSANGIPAWSQRVKACGNAVVPQIAQWIAERIKESVNV
jgi:DNA (cytosine-5)-methyltransferase 1